MKDKEKLFKLLRAAVETSAESTALEDFIKKSIVKCHRLKL